MILIDASNINSGGGKILLEYLIDQLLERKIEFFLLKDERLDSQIHSKSFEFANISSYNRTKSLKKYFNLLNPQVVFCFGNFPPPVKLNCKTLTYFQNLTLLDSVYEQIKNDKLFFLKKIYLSYYLKNTNMIIFQNNKIQNHFKNVFGRYAGSEMKFINIPFFNDEEIRDFKKKGGVKQKILNSFIYVSLPYKHKNHERLLKTWEILAENGFYPQLTLTIPISNLELINKINDLNKKGLKIKNIGLVSFQEILEHTSQSEFCIFPSLKETFGLSLIEGVLLDCKVIASDLDYVYEVLKPSMVFDPYNPNDIAEKVKFCLLNNGKIKASVPLVENKIENLINALTTF